MLRKRQRSSPTEVFWRVEGPGQLLPAQGVRQTGYFVRNAQGFRRRASRSFLFALAAAFHPFLRGGRPDLATRALHACLRGLSRDRLDFLGEEYARRVLIPRLSPGGVARLRRRLDRGDRVVLVSGWLDHVVRPLARHLGVESVLCNRLEFRGAEATGRLEGPVVAARAGMETLRAAIRPTTPAPPRDGRALVLYDGAAPPGPLSVRDTMRDREVLLVGVTGFIGKVWLANFLADLPDVGKVHLLIRRRGPMSGRARFDRLVRESPVLRAIDPKLLAGKVEVVEGDLERSGLGLSDADRARLQDRLDLIVNSGGLTEFNPDVRAALAANVDSTLHTLEFLRGCRKAALMHLSTVYVAGKRSGRIPETAGPRRNPLGLADGDPGRILEELRARIAAVEEEGARGQVVDPVRSNGKPMTEAQLRKACQRWVRETLTTLGTERALALGWTNTYTFTKGLAECLIEERAADLPVAIVRPSIVETSMNRPFRGWNEGVNTSAPLSWLCGTLFRQLPTKPSVHLDVIPVDTVTRGMNLIAAALVRRIHRRCYQLATSVTNPATTPRVIELVALAHRRHYREQPGLDAWLRTHFESIPVSMRRYRMFSVPAQKAVVRTLRRILPFVGTPLKRMERTLDRVENMIELFEPFIHDNDYLFEADHVRMLHAALVPEQREIFGYDAARIDWLSYWVDIHIPALRKWSYPLLEGRPVEG